MSCVNSPEMVLTILVVFKLVFPCVKGGHTFYPELFLLTGRREAIQTIYRITAPAPPTPILD